MTGLHVLSTIQPWVDSISKKKGHGWTLKKQKTSLLGYRFLLFFLDQNIFNTKVADIQVILPENIPTLHSFVLVLSFYMRK